MRFSSHSSVLYELFVTLEPSKPETLANMRSGILLALILTACVVLSEGHVLRRDAPGPEPAPPGTSNSNLLLNHKFSVIS